MNKLDTYVEVRLYPDEGYTEWAESHSLNIAPIIVYPAYAGEEDYSEAINAAIKGAINTASFPIKSVFLFVSGPARRYFMEEADWPGLVDAHNSVYEGWRERK